VSGQPARDDAPAAVSPAAGEGAAALPAWQPTKRNLGATVAEIAGLEVLPLLYNKYVSDADFAQVTWKTILRNIQTGFTYDADKFSTNQASHPNHGTYYFNAARSNGYTFWESGAFTLVGSFVWEIATETEPPALNDLVSTTLGGMTRGEVQSRIATMIRDNTSRGLDRILREAAAFVLDPLSGLNRALRGEIGKRYENPPDRFPSRLFLELDGLYQHQIAPERNGDGASQGGVSAFLRYGDLFDGPHPRPFDYFDGIAEFIQPTDSVITQLNLRGLLADRVVSEAPRTEQRLGVFLHFIYFNDSPLLYGAQAFAVNHELRIPLGRGFDLRSETGLSAVPLGAVRTDSQENLGDDATLRGYDYSIGGGVQAVASVRRRGLDVASVGWTTTWLHTVNGHGDNTRLETFLADGRIPLSELVAVGGGWAWTSRLSTYPVWPTVNVSSSTWRVFGAVTFR
jgi:hypothetical protein